MGRGGKKNNAILRQWGSLAKLDPHGRIGAQSDRLALRWL